MKKCEKCGKTYEDSQLFCGACGGPLTSVQTFTGEVSGQPVTNAEAVPENKNFLVSNWPFFVAIIGYALSWVDGGAIFGTAVSILAAIAGWGKSNGKPICKNLALRIIGTVFAALALFEIFLYL